MRTLQNFIDTRFPYEPGRSPDLGQQIILVSGAGGSIGSSLVKYLIEQANAQIVAVEQDEWRLIQLREALGHNTQLQPVLGSVYDPEVMESIFLSFPIDCFVHTASYKHVSFLETQKKTLINYNILEPLKLLKTVANHKIPHFIQLSSDKAIEPVSLMGKAKFLIDYLGGNIIPEIFCSLRPGNVLGSRGSVLPKWWEAHLQGKPLQLSDPKALRHYFRVEAVVEALVELIAQPKSGVFVPKGEKTVTLQQLFADLCMYLDTELPIELIGLQPAEKREERLFWPSEKRSSHGRMLTQAKLPAKDKNNWLRSINSDLGLNK